MIYDGEEFSPRAALRAGREGTLSGEMTISRDGDYTVIRHHEVGSWDDVIDDMTDPAIRGIEAELADEELSGMQTPPASFLPLVQKANRDLAMLLSPFGPVIDKLPNPPYYRSFTQDLKNYPIDALIGLADPTVEMFLRDSTEAANRISGVRTRRVGIPGINQRDIEMGLEVPADLPLDARNYLRRLKLVMNIMTLIFQDPVSVAKGIVETLQKNAAQAKDFVTGIITQAATVGVKVPGLGALPAGTIKAPTGRFLEELVKRLQSGFRSQFDDVVRNAGAEVRRQAEQARQAVEDAARRAAEAAGKAAEDARKAAEDLARRATPPSPPKFFRGFGEAAVGTGVAAGAGGTVVSTTAASGGGSAAAVGAAGATAEASTPATVPAMAALLAAIIAYAQEHPEQVEAGIQIAKGAGKTGEELAKKDLPIPGKRGAAEDRPPAEDRTPPPEDRPPPEEEKSEIPWGTIGLVAGGVAAAGTAAYLLTRPKHNPRRRRMRR